jgi:hypothetical protein
MIRVAGAQTLAQAQAIGGGVGQAVDVVQAQAVDEPSA